MSEPISDRRIKVTAQERSHPAIRKLARACLAIARQQLGMDRQPDTAGEGTSQLQRREVTND
jgi:hypothetical protein